MYICVYIKYIKHTHNRAYIYIYIYIYMHDYVFVIRPCETFFLVKYRS